MTIILLLLITVLLLLFSMNKENCIRIIICTCELDTFLGELSLSLLEHKGKGKNGQGIYSCSNIAHHTIHHTYPYTCPDDMINTIYISKRFFPSFFSSFSFITCLLSLLIFVPFCYYEFCMNIFLRPLYCSHTHAT